MSKNQIIPKSNRTEADCLMHSDGNSVRFHTKNSVITLCLCIYHPLREGEQLIKGDERYRCSTENKISLDLKTCNFRVVLNFNINLKYCT